MINETLSNITTVKTPIQIFQIVIYSAVSFLGATGNGLVIWFCLVRMKKTVNVVWFLNLAMADFTFAMLLPFVITRTILDFHWPFGDFMCRLIWFLLFLNMVISVLQLMVISLDRCVNVLFPVWCRKHRTRRLALIVLLIIWVISVTLTLPSYILRITINKEGKINCILGAGENWIPLTRFFLFFLVPLIVIVSCYTIIMLHIKDKSIIRSSKPLKLIVAVVFAFFVCWCPYYFFVLFGLFQSRSNDFFRIGIEISVALMLFNSCINPFLYVFIGRDFKQKFWGSFQAMLEKAFKEDTEKTDMKNSKTQSSVEHRLTSFYVKDKAPNRS
ncbi:hypothetical protein GDO81_025999 [Engystomops pustulosus]|uniref:G-protein coupled receptors family 1 profile domain-containing protein n=2 Tax=Engystomops pustulosus TaxID=76066 RepID=A0AAV6ZJ06_ENGPU|nr:hypothetical protein GDO81_025999 [Engystomops pustulosus]